MNHPSSKLCLFSLLLLLTIVVCVRRGDAQKADATLKREVPKTWVDDKLANLELPLANPASSPKHISAEYYYRIPVRPIYKSYPIYAPGKEPPGYLERLGKLDPQITFDAAKLRTEQDWIKAGELVFDAPIELVSSGTLVAEVRDPAWYEKNHVPVTRDGIFPNMQYVVREKGKVEVGILSCAHCHGNLVDSVHNDD